MSLFLSFLLKYSWFTVLWRSFFFFFLKVGIYCCNLSSFWFRLTWTHFASHKFWYFVFPIFICFKIFLISLMIYYMTHGLFIGCWLISTYLWIFCFSCYNLFHNIVVRKDVSYNFNFKFIKTFLWPNIWSILEIVSYLLKKNMYCAAAGCLFCACLLGQFGRTCSLSPVFLY